MSGEKGFGLLQSVYAPCLRCNNEVNGFLVPDGRFICPNCDPPAVFERWKRAWEPHEKAYRKKNRKKGFWRFHLITALLLLITLGILLLLNYRQKRIDVSRIGIISIPGLTDNSDDEGEEVPPGFYQNFYGWPLSAMSAGAFYDGPSEQHEVGNDKSTRIRINDSDSTIVLTYFDAGRMSQESTIAMGDKVFYLTPAIINAVVALCILVAVAFASEFLIRRRQSPAKLSPPSSGVPQ